MKADRKEPEVDYMVEIRSDSSQGAMGSKGRMEGLDKINRTFTSTSVSSQAGTFC